MTPIARIAGLGLLLALAPPAGAGKFNKKLSVGDRAPSWENLDGTDGKKHALADLKAADVVVVVFTCNTCPVATDYEDRIVAFASGHAGPGGKVAVVAINPNTVKGDQLADMKKRAEKKKFPFAYLHDPSQETARAFGANFTPEFFVLDRDRRVVYMGAMDDKSPPTEPTAKYLEAGLKAALEGKKAGTGETSAAAGCRIRFNPKRDD
jgi:peroxiredoxin